MTKKYLREFITNLMPSSKTEEEREIIIREIMKYIGTSPSLNTKISQYDDKGHLGVFYDTKDARLFREEIKDYLSKRPEPKRENTLPPQGGLEKEVKKRGRPKKTSREYEEDYSPLPNQITPNEACKHLEERHHVQISPKDLRKIMGDMPLTRPSIDDAHKFGMYDLTPTILVASKFRIYEVTINNKKGVPRYYCDRDNILHGFLKEKS